MPRTSGPTEGQPHLERSPSDHRSGEDADESGDRLDPEEVGQLRTEVERLRNELFLARQERAVAWRQGRAEGYSQIVEHVAHELRASLTVVLGWSELLIGGNLSPDKLPQAYDTIYEAGWRVEATLRWLERVVERDLRPSNGHSLDSPVGDADEPSLADWPNGPARPPAGQLT